MRRRFRPLSPFVLIGLLLYLIWSLKSEFRPTEYRSFNHAGLNKPSAPLLARLSSGDHRFLWSDWLDLSNADSFLQGGEEPNGIIKTIYPDESHFPPTGRPLEEVSALGQLYCKYNFSAPYQIAVLAPQTHVTPVNITLYPVAHERDSTLDHKQYGGSSIEGTASIKPVPQKELEIDGSLFEWQPSKDIAIQKALGDVKSSGKHFFEASLKSEARHYDWRFFRGELSFEENLQGLHELARAWSSFTRAAGILSWYAHGSLLGWKWNGLTMPWDTDHDVQMPIVEVDKLGRFWNRTLVVQGDKKYLIDVSPWYVERNRGNRHNLIDARFIDIHSGMFIDITGLAKLSHTYMCKNLHSYSLKQLSPLHLSTFEGSPSFIPNDVDGVLLSEYKHYNEVQTGQWRFNSIIRLWETTILCDVANYRRLRCPLADIPDKCEDWEYGTCDNTMLRYFEMTKDVTGYHKDFPLEAAVFPVFNYDRKLPKT